MTHSGIANVVVVHGAWADGSIWKDVLHGLRKEGLRVTAAPIPLTSFGDDTAALKRAIARMDGPTVVVGHAYAGAIIATANEERVKALVYIAALAPEEGETVANIFYRDAPHDLAPRLAPDADGYLWMPDDGFRNAFAQNATAEQVALLAAVQRPIAVKCIQEPVPRPAWKSTPSWFLIAEEDRMINPRTQHFMAERMRATVRSHCVDHAPLITAPDKVIDLILEANKAACS